MKSRTLTCITAIMLFAALDVPVQLAAQVGGTGTTNRIPIWTNCRGHVSMRSGWAVFGHNDERSAC